MRWVISSVIHVTWYVGELVTQVGALGLTELSDLGNIEESDEGGLVPIQLLSLKLVS